MHPRHNLTYAQLQAAKRREEARLFGAAILAALAGSIIGAAFALAF